MLCAGMPTIRVPVQKFRSGECGRLLESLGDASEVVGCKFIQLETAYVVAVCKFLLPATAPIKAAGYCAVFVALYHR